MDKLNSFHLNAKYVHFPTKEDTAVDIYRVLFSKEFPMNSLNPFAQHMLYAFNRYEYFLKHKEELEDCIAVCDRYTTSSISYQTASYLSKLPLAADGHTWNMEHEHYLSSVHSMGLYNNIPAVKASEYLRAPITGEEMIEYIENIEYGILGLKNQI